MADSQTEVLYSCVHPKRRVAPQRAGGFIQVGGPRIKWNRKGHRHKNALKGRQLAGKTVGLLKFGELDSGPEVDFVQHSLELWVRETLLAATHRGCQPVKGRPWDSAGQQAVTYLIQHVQQLLAM